MPSGVPITPEKEDEILAALEADSHASRVAGKIGDVSFTTVWRVADRAGIELKAGREAKGYKRLPAEQWTRIAETITRNPEATQEQVARATGVSRSTVGRVKRGIRHGAAVASAG
jgi:hypothetical protein